MARRVTNTDWASQVPQTRKRGPYRDYGWEAGQSSLPQFRDPSVHLTPEEEAEVRAWRERSERASARSQERASSSRSRGRPVRSEYFGEEYGREYDPSGYYVGGFGRGFDDEGNFSVNRGWNMPGPHQGVGPQSYRRSDERILEDVCERLTRHGYIDASDIEVQVDNGEVTLSGQIDSRQTKRLAEDIADSVSGVWDIHNRLQVSKPENSPQNRLDQVGESGVYPVSGPLPESNAPVHDMGSWGDPDQEEDRHG